MCCQVFDMAKNEIYSEHLQQMLLICCFKSNFVDEMEAVVIQNLYRCSSGCPSCRCQRNVVGPRIQMDDAGETILGENQLYMLLN